MTLGYSDLMIEGTPFIRVRIETADPIELSDFLKAFSSIGSEYERIVGVVRPDLQPDAKMFVSEVQRGSIIADLVPFIMPVMQAAEYALITDQVITRVREIVYAYQSSERPALDVGKSELKDVVDGLVAIANDRNGRADLQSIVIEGGRTNVRAAMTFNTPEARTAIGNIREHIRLIEHHEDENRTMVLMRFFQPNLKDADLQARSGEQVIIDAISTKPRPLVYASEMAKQRIKHELSEGDGNVFKKGFYVDVIVDKVGERIAAYKVTNFHQVIDLPD